MILSLEQPLFRPIPLIEGKPYRVLDDPAPLAGMADPGMNLAWPLLREANFKWVCCLNNPNPAYNPSPLQLLIAVELEDLFGGKHPTDPVTERSKIMRAGLLIAKKLQAGEGVVVHCGAGIGRTGTVLGVVLRLLGCSAHDTRTFLNAVQTARGNPGWPESDWQGEIIAEPLATIV